MADVCQHHLWDYVHEIETEHEIKTFTIVSRALGCRLTLTDGLSQMRQDARRSPSWRDQLFRDSGFIEPIDTDAATNLPDPLEARLREVVL